MPETVAGRFCLAWPDRLSLYDMNRLVRAKRTCSIPDELGRLGGKGICMTSEEAYSLIEQLYALWEKLGFYPLDPDRVSPFPRFSGLGLITRAVHPSS